MIPPFLLAFGILFFSLQSSSHFALSIGPRSTQGPLAKMFSAELLPGNPIYGLAMVKDRVLLTLTLSPKANGWLQVEYANTRLHTAERLADQDETARAIATLSKSQIYLGHATELLRNHDKQHLADLKPILLSHQKSLLNLKTKIDGPQLEELIRYNASLIDSAFAK